MRFHSNDFTNLPGYKINRGEALGKGHKVATDLFWNDRTDRFLKSVTDNLTGDRIEHVDLTVYHVYPEQAA